MAFSFHKSLAFAILCLCSASPLLAQSYDLSLEATETLAKNGNVHRQFELGQMYYYGQNGARKNIKEAENWLKKAADKGDSDAAMLLGQIYLKGEADKVGKPNYDKAIKYFKQIVDKGSENKMEAYYYLGQCYNGKNDYTKAINYFELSANGGYLPAQQYLADLYYQHRNVDSENRRQYIYWSERAAQNGDRSRMESLANMYLEENDVDKALKWFKESAFAGNAESAFKVGMIYFDGIRVRKDYSEAAKYLKQASDGGYTEADNYAGLCYLYGLGVKDNANSAAKYFAKDSNSLISQFYLAVCSRLGGTRNINGELSYGEIKKKYANTTKQIYDFNEFNRETTVRLADDGSNPMASYVLGIIYSYGIANPVNPNKAFYFFKEAGDRNVAPALTELGYCYEVGEGTTQNIVRAADCYRRAAQLGDAVAQNNMGSFYANGDGMAKNPEEAVKYYQMAANQGYAPAQCNLGYCFETGEGIGRANPQQAVLWYKKAADQGYALAQCNLGYCYENGIGVTKNLKEAVRYYQLAADQNNERALDNLTSIYSNIQKIDDTNLAKAARYLQMAVERGSTNPQLLYLLAYCYDHGLGIERDSQKAYRLYQEAADRGDTRAEDILNRLKR